MIKPGVGRVVHFWPGPQASQLLQSSDGQPLAAIIAHVWTDRLINVMVINTRGITVGVERVVLLQDDDQGPKGKVSYCEWMDYQKGQAAKTEQLEHTITVLGLAEKPSAVRPRAKRTVRSRNKAGKRKGVSRRSRR